MESIIYGKLKYTLYSNIGDEEDDGNNYRWKVGGSG